MSNEKAAVEEWRTYAACTGPCGQDSRNCKTRQACGLSESAEPSRYDDEALPLLRWLGCAVAMVVAAIVLAVLFGAPHV